MGGDMAASGKWRRFARNPRAMAAAALLAAAFAASLALPPFLPPPGEVVEPSSLEPFRRVVARISPQLRAGRLDIDQALGVVQETGCAAFSPAIAAGAPLGSAIKLPDGLPEAVAARFANSPAPAATFAATLPDGSAAELSLQEFRPRAAPPRAVRIRMRDPDSSVSARTAYRTLPRQAISGDEPTPEDVARARALLNLPGGDGAPSLTLSLEPVAWPFRPVAGHPCGIDSAGRDVLSRIVAGTRIALVFGFALVLSSMLLGIAAGAAQGYFGGWVDIAAQRLIEIWSALPFLYVMMLVGSVFGRSFALLLLCYGLFNWIGVSYYMRAEFLRLRARPFVEAARCQGFPPWRIICGHILPNALTPVVTLLPFSLIGAIASISALDFLGFGLPPLTPSLGELLRQAQQNTSAWWLILYPALTLFAVMLFAVFVGEGLRDAFDPKPAARYE